MSTALKKDDDKKYAYADYITWDDDKRYELIDGVPYAMAGTRPRHQRIAVNLLWKIREHLEGKKCEVFTAPVDVRLNHKKGDDVVVQPDLFVVCNPDIIKDTHIKGTPDLVIEILSPSNAFHDKGRKFLKYKEAGVKEIWFVDPANNLLETHIHNGTAYDMAVYGRQENATTDILPDLIINLIDIFGEEKEPEAEV